MIDIDNYDLQLEAVVSYKTFNRRFFSTFLNKNQFYWPIYMKWKKSLKLH